MRRTVYVCDRCGAEAAPVFEVRTARDQPARPGKDKITMADLCADCAATALTLLSDDLPADQAKAVARFVDNGPAGGKADPPPGPEPEPDPPGARGPWRFDPHTIPMWWDAKKDRVVFSRTLGTPGTALEQFVAAIEAAVNGRP